jgi:D-aspartate ligase
MGLAVLMGDLTILRPLGAAGVRAVVVTTDPRDPTLRSRYADGARVVPGYTGDDAQAETVRTLCQLGDALVAERGRRTPLLFGTDAQLAMVHAHDEELRERYLYLVNRPELGRTLLDKERFASFAARAGVPVPRTVGFGEEIGGPLLVKPKRKTDWHGLQSALFDGRGKARTFASARELRACDELREYADQVVVQELIHHRPDGLLSFHAFADEESQILASFVGRKIRTYPSDAGESSYIELASDAAIDALGRRVTRALGLRGPFKIDIVREEGTGRDLVLEVNARFTLWSYLGAVSGVNLPAIACAYLERGEIPGPRRARTDFRWLNFYRDYHAFRERRALGTIGVGEWLASLAPRHKVYETFAWRDPRPFASWLGQSVRERLQVH